MRDPTFRTMFRTLIVVVLTAVTITTPSNAHPATSMPNRNSVTFPASSGDVTNIETGTLHPTAKMSDPCTDINQCSFIDRLNKYDKSRWTFAHDYANGISFANWWSRHRVSFNKKYKRMDITVGRNPRHGKPYVSGQMQSRKWHGYGCYEVRMKPGNQEGLITTFFSFTGKYDAAPGKPKKHNEVDIEFVYKRRYKKIMLQANYFTNGRGGHEHLIKLPFDPVKKMNNYAFKWTSKRISWYVNGKKMYSTTKDIPKIAMGPHKIMMSLWPVSAHSAAWAGNYTWQGKKTASYRAMRFTRGERCKIYNKFFG